MPHNPRDYFKGSTYLEPRYNPAFLALLGREYALISFLNATLHFEGLDRIKSLRFQTESLSEFRVPDPFRVRFDIHAKTMDGRCIDIEMQKSRGENYVDRMLLYNAVMLIDSKNEFDRNHELSKPSPTERNAYRYALPAVYSIWICDFLLDELKNFPEYRDEWSVYSKNAISHGVVRSVDEKNRYIVIELSKFRKTVSELKNAEDEWLYILANAGSNAELPEFRDDVFSDALKRIEVLRVDSNLLSDQENNIMEENYFEICAAERAFKMAKDMAKGMASDMAKGMANDMAKGMAKNMAKDMAKVMAKDMAEGIAEKRVAEIALGFRNAGVPLDVISKQTGLSVEEIRNLK